MNTDFIEIARYASKAPSGHNTQPWKFRIIGDAITVVPCLDVALPIVDNDNRELYISLGCALENLCIAASHFGYEAQVAACNAENITVKLISKQDTPEDRLFHQIEKRQTNRSIYNSDKVSDETLKQLQSIHKEADIELYFTEIGTPIANVLTRYIMKGNEIQMNDKAFKNELLSWMRFNKKQIETTQSGLSYRVFGNPPLPGILARPIVSSFLKPAVQNKSDKKKIDSSSHFVVFTTRQNTLNEWINTGRVLQRFLLKATERGIACAFLNQPCEIATLASLLQETLPINKDYPTLIVRMGYAQPLPYAPRKEISTLLV